MKFEIINKLENIFNAPQQFINSLLTNITNHAIQFVPQEKFSMLRDSQDNFLLELAKDAKADYLISLDKDVLMLKQYNDTKIVSPAEFLQIFM